MRGGGVTEGGEEEGEAWHAGREERTDGGKECYVFSDNGHGACMCTYTTQHCDLLLYCRQVTPPAIPPGYPR